MIPYEDIISGHYHESSDCFEYPEKKPYLNQATKIRKLAKFSFPQKNPGIEISNPSKILRSSPVTWNLENPPPPGYCHPTRVAMHPCFYEQMIFKFSIKTELQFKILQTQGRRKTAITKNENYPRVNLSIWVLSRWNELAVFTQNIHFEVPALDSARSLKLWHF